MASYESAYWASSLTGGGTGALDSIDGDSVQGGDICIVITSTYVYVYELDAAVGGAESSPTKITPDANAGTKRWVLRNFYLGTVDHGDFSGLTDDDHTQYALVDGSRSFTGTVGGLTPVANADFTTKGYVDGEVTTLSGTMASLAYLDTLLATVKRGTETLSSGISSITVSYDGNFSDTDYQLAASLKNTTDGDPSIYPLLIISTTISGFTAEFAGELDSANYTLDYIAMTTSGSVLAGDVDHGSLGGLTDDDHTIYSKADGTRAFSGVIEGVTPTADAHLATKGYVDSVGDAKMVDLSDDTDPELGGDLDLAGYYIQLDSVPDADHSGSGYMAYMTVDQNTTGFAGALHIDTDGNCVDADKDSINTMPCQVLALQTGTGSKRVLLRGFIRDDSWAWTPGGPIYVGDSGALTQTAPSAAGDIIQIVGYATHADRIYFDPANTTLEVG